MADRIFIYCLWCPLTKRIRYIGKTNAPKNRLFLHLSAASKGAKHHTARWLRQLANLNLTPKIKIVFRIPEGEDWRIHERRLINLALKKKLPLTNQTAGGDGVEFISEEDFARAKLARKNGFTDEVKQRMAQSGKLAWSDPVIRKNRVAKMKIAANDYKRKQELKIAGRSRTPAGEAKRLAAVNLYWGDPINRQKQAKRTAETNKLKGHL